MSASNDDELAILRHQRKLELQKQIEAQASKQVEAEFAEQKKQIEASQSKEMVCSHLRHASSVKSRTGVPRMKMISLVAFYLL